MIIKLGLLGLTVTSITSSGNSNKVYSDKRAASPLLTKGEKNNNALCSSVMNGN